MSLVHHYSFVKSGCKWHDSRVLHRLGSSPALLLFARRRLRRFSLYSCRIAQLNARHRRKMVPFVLYDLQGAGKGEGREREAREGAARKKKEVRTLHGS